VALDTLAPFLLLPAFGFGIAAMRVVAGMREARAMGYRGISPAPGLPPNTRGPLITMLVLPSTTMLFGLVLGFLAVGKGPGYELVLLPLATAFGLAGMGTAVAEGILFRGGSRQLAQNPIMFGRLITVAVNLEVNVIFALVTSFLVLSRLDGSGAALPLDTAEGLIAISRLIPFFGLVAIAQAFVILAQNSTGQKWFLGGILRGAALQVISVLLLIYQFLALGAIPR